MPVYLYRCDKFGGGGEERQHPMSSTESQRCGNCGRVMRLLYSAPATVYKGTGWAKKDRRESNG